MLQHRNHILFKAKPFRAHWSSEPLRTKAKRNMRCKIIHAKLIKLLVARKHRCLMQKCHPSATKKIELAGVTRGYRIMVISQARYISVLRLCKERILKLMETQPLQNASANLPSKHQSSTRASSSPMLVAKLVKVSLISLPLTSTTIRLPRSLSGTPSLGAPKSRT